MDDKLIVIATETHSSALVLQSYLESKGIECFLNNTDPVQPNPGDGVRVQIRERDTQRAIELLARVSAPVRGELSPRKIIVPVDFSESSVSAAHLALGLAHRYGSEVKILHVFSSPMVDLIPFTDAASIQIDVDINHQAVQKGAKQKLLKLHRELQEYATAKGLDRVKIGYSLREGFTGYGIVDACRRYKPGLVVMGTKGEGFGSTELVGSVAAEVVRETHVPLLVIPEGVVLRDMQQVKNVLYVTTLDSKDYLSIRKLSSIVSGFRVSITCAYISEEPDNPIVMGLANQLKQYFHRVSKKVPMEFVTLKGKSKGEALLDYIRKGNVDLLAITMHKRSLIERIFNPSLTRMMLSKAKVPLLIFPD